MDLKRKRGMKLQMAQWEEKNGGPAFGGQSVLKGQVERWGKGRVKTTGNSQMSGSLHTHYPPPVPMLIF